MPHSPCAATGRWTPARLLSASSRLLAVALLLAPVGAAQCPPFLTKWGSGGDRDGQFNRSRGLTVSAAGDVYVADTFNDRIQKFDANGTFLFEIDDRLRKPSGVATDAAGNLYVADTHRNRIRKYDSTGQFLTEFGSQGAGNGQFESPSDVAVDPAGNLYVADTGNHRVQKLDATGGYLAQWNGLSAPRGIATDDAGSMFVADSGHNRILVYDAGGTLQCEWGSSGSGDGEFSNPTGIDVDGRGIVYVADAFNHRIQTFDSCGAFLCKWGARGAGDGDLSQVHDVAPSPSGDVVYVCDFGNSRIQAFGRASLTLAADDDELDVASAPTLNLRTFAGEPGALSALVVTDIDGFALWLLVATNLLDANGHWILSLPASDPALIGHAVTLCTFSLDASDRLVHTDGETVRFR